MCRVPWPTFVSSTVERFPWQCSWTLNNQEHSLNKCYTNSNNTWKKLWQQISFLDNHMKQWLITMFRKTLSDFCLRLLRGPCSCTFGLCRTLFCFGRLCIEQVSIQVYGCQNFVRNFKVVIDGSRLFVGRAFLREIDFGRKLIWGRYKSTRVGWQRLAILRFESLRCCKNIKREKTHSLLSWWLCTLELLVLI